MSGYSSVNGVEAEFCTYSENVVGRHYWERERVNWRIK
jgi:hypothetical protein